MPTEQCLLLNLWKYFYSHNLGNTGIDQTQNSVKELSPGPEIFFSQCEIKKRLYFPSQRKRLARHLGTQLCLSFQEVGEGRFHSSLVCLVEADN